MAEALTTIFAATPIGTPQLVILVLGFLVLALTTIRSRRAARAPDAGNGGRRSLQSIVGIVVQGIGIGCAGFGGIQPSLAWDAPAALMGAIVTLLFMGAACWIFVAAVNAMGKNWSLVARTRGDHELVTDGPFALVRHPIYLCLFLMMIGFAAATGHWGGLIPGIPLFTIGTLMRTSEEERLLRAHFGQAYDDYAARVKRFVPGLL